MPAGSVTPVGGGTVAHGFAATLGNDTSFNNGATVIPDSVFHDTGSYYNATTGVATIPAGLGGLYLLSYYGETATANVTSLTIKVVVSGAFDNVVFSAGSIEAGVVFDLAGGVVAYFSAGNSMHGVVSVSGAAAATLVGNQTGFGLAYLGAA